MFRYNLLAGVLLAVSLLFPGCASPVKTAGKVAGKAAVKGAKTSAKTSVTGAKARASSSSGGRLASTIDGEKRSRTWSKVMPGSRGSNTSAGARS